MAFLKSNIQKIGIFFVSGVVYVAGKLILAEWIDHVVNSVCGKSLSNENYFCNVSFSQSLGWPLITAGELLAVVAIILLFANESGLRRWWRFSRVFVPVSAGLIIFLANFFSLPITGLISPEPLILLAGIIYIISTAVIVIRDRFVGVSR